MDGGGYDRDNAQAERRVFRRGRVHRRRGAIGICEQRRRVLYADFRDIRLFDLFRRNINERKYKDFYEYKESKKDKKHGFGFMLVVGLVFIAIAGAFLAAYYNV